MENISAVLLVCGFSVCSMAHSEIAPVSGYGHLSGVPSTALCPETVEKVLQERLARFDETMEPGYLDKALNALKELPDHDGRGRPMPEVNKFKLKGLFRIFRVATESIDARYIPAMSRAQQRSGQVLPEQPPIPDKVPSKYLYNYIQFGLRMFRT